MKKSTLWIIGVSTAVLTVVGLGATVGKQRREHYKEFGRSHHYYKNDCNDRTNKDSLKRN